MDRTMLFMSFNANMIMFIWELIVQDQMQFGLDFKWNLLI